MKIFVTGGHGFIGARVVRQLVRSGHQVTLLVRPHSNLRRVQDLSCPTALGDVLVPETLAGAMKGHEACIHLACSCAWELVDSDEIERVVLQGTMNVLRAAKAAGVTRIVHVSSSAAIGARWDATVLDESTLDMGAAETLRYARAKNRAELLAREFAHSEGLPLAIANPAETYGADDGFVTSGNLRDILTGWPAVSCTGGVCLTHVDDVASGIVAALERGRAQERYILGGENLTVPELVRLTLELGGQRKPILRIPNALLRGVVRTLSSWNLPTPVQPIALDYAMRFWFCSSEKAKQELGYTWRTAREVLAAPIEWLQSEGHVKTSVSERKLRLSAPPEP